MNKKFQASFLRIGKISGIYYTVPGRTVNRIVLYGRGAPLTPDNGGFTAAPYILDFETDLYVPDYIGSGRSEGKFTPLGCIKTFLDLYEAFSGGCTARNSYENLSLKLQYDEIHFMGGSLGGAYVPLLPKFNKHIKNLCIMYPVVDWRTQGKTDLPEETLERFTKAMKDDGYKYLYRGILDKVWIKHFKGGDSLNPIDNLQYFGEARLFIGHGKKDVNINYKKSLNYYKKILKLFPDKKDQFKLRLYPFDHSDKTSNRAVVDYLRWMGVPRAV